MTIFAAFLLAPCGVTGGICATTRTNGSVGLPGGKVDPGETPEQAVRREASEEGWTLPADAVLTCVHRAQVDGRPVAWYATTSRPTRSAGGHKEAARGIWPTCRPAKSLSGFGNPEAVEAWEAWQRRAAFAGYR